MKKIFSSKILKNKIYKRILIVLITAGICLTGYTIYDRIAAKASTSKNLVELTAWAARGNIDVKLSGTGTVQPVSRCDIVPLVKGKILNASFEQGMEVKKGDLLYQIDDSDLHNSIEKARNSIEKQKLNNKSTDNSIKNLIVLAPGTGWLKNFSIKEGDQIGNANSKIGDIVNDKKFTVQAPFYASQVHKIKSGQKAQLVLAKYMTYIEGEVTDISRNLKLAQDGSVLCDVEIIADNPGTLIEGMQVSAIIEVDNEEIESAGESGIKCYEEYPLYAETTGEVGKILVKNDEWVEKGQKIMELENENLNVTSQRNALDLKDLELALALQIKQLDDYNILSPINGTIIKIDYKAGDTINAANSNTVLMTIVDTSKMKFTMDVDELDISKIAEGQKVSIASDALPETTLEGKVTAIPVEGKSQNGVTTYPVEITIDQPGNLKSGMNINAEIFVESKQNVLYVPMAAVNKTGGRTFVYVKDDSAKQQNGNTQQSASPWQNGSAQQNAGSGQQRPSRQDAMNGDRTQQYSGNWGQGNFQGRMQEGAQQTPGEGTQDFQNRFANARRNTAGSSAAAVNSLEGRTIREVVVGINNEDYIEIVSGLNEGEIVILPTVATNNNSSNTPSGIFGQPGMGGFRIQGGGGAGGAVTRTTGGFNGR
ncbi:MAG TPA: HlyD family efflux transporter periplasmic adaptor subunit [Clostridiales bacterium]|nr:HlyD family efflux transporter periplasmic adaptor subunit [Clostridiales bacterium]